eukprot:CAMPEP_0170574792 /NCGR_PEP_ID=MMETSP0224-20130122/3495_1 /TAXON_ID=285029 /ORGANISM="Togula jolla, Strain CCCM 725" /LENGTH=315 /DNA_ID=CAMNT_0010897485 /DNA_START=449 /DNA_END=1400 /DNA_ORIENTATION=+
MKRALLQLTLLTEPFLVERLALELLAALSINSAELLLPRFERSWVLVFGASALTHASISDRVWRIWADSSFMVLSLLSRKRCFLSMASEYSCVKHLPGFRRGVNDLLPSEGLRRSVAGGGLLSSWRRGSLYINDIGDPKSDIELEIALPLEVARSEVGVSGQDFPEVPAAGLRSDSFKPGDTMLWQATAPGVEAGRQLHQALPHQDACHKEYHDDAPLSPGMTSEQQPHLVAAKAPRSMSESTGASRTTASTAIPSRLRASPLALTGAAQGLRGGGVSSMADRGCFPHSGEAGAGVVTAAFKLPLFTGYFGVAPA